MKEESGLAPDSTDASDDEISLREIFARLWRQRGVLVVLPLLALCLAAIAVGFTVWSAQNPIVYYITLSNIDKGEYPNGAAFSPQDLLNPDVLAKLRERFNPEPGTNLRRYIQVSYDSPIAVSISQKYNDRLSAKNLTQADIDALNAAYESELKSTISSGLRIDVNYVQLGVSKDTGMAIANALPEIWSQVYSQQYRVFLDTKLVQAAVTSENETLADTSSILVADQRLRNINNGLEIIGGDNRLAALTTNDGFSAEDLDQEVERFRTIYFTALFASGFAEGDPASQAYLRDRRLEIADLERRTAGIDQNLADLRDYQATAMGSGPASNGAARPGNSEIEITEGALNQIAGLVKASSFAEYMTKLLDERQELVKQISLLRKDIELATTTDKIADIAAFRGQASTALQTLTKRYQDLLAQARVRSTEQNRQFYRERSSPVVAGSLVPKRSLLLLAIAFLIGLVVAIAYALLKPLLPTSPSRSR